MLVVETVAKIRRAYFVQARKLLDSIDTSIVVGLRDRAPIGVMTLGPSIDWG